MAADRRRDRSGWGQALLEFALAFPIFVALLFAIVNLGLYVFYNQQLENAAREAARYAAIHSSTAQCPTVSRLDPIGSNRAETYLRCDSPEAGWPRMTAAGRSHIWGMDPGTVAIRACWSGYVDATGNADALPMDPNTFTQCTIGGVSPLTDPGGLACPAGPAVVSPSGGTDGDDKASALAFANGIHYPTTVTVYACVDWSPPIPDIAFLPSRITIQAIATEALQRQQ